MQLQTELLVNYLYDLEVIGNRDAFRRFSEECMGLLANGNIKEYFH